MFRTLRFYHSFFKFLSTPSSRRATGAARHHATVPTYFYPRPPRGGRRTSGGLGIGIQNDFYPRPPRGGRQKNLRKKSKSSSFLSTPSARRATSDVLELKTAQLFLSTPSARRATGPGLDPHPGSVISIHALREEGDLTVLLCSRCNTYFYPRPPRGGRPPPAAGFRGRWWISIHALREEGDAAGSPQHAGCRRFLSTPSARRATCGQALCC